MSRQLRLVFVVMALIVLAGAGGWLAASSLLPYEYHGQELRPPQPVADFTLTAAGDRRVSLSQFRGKLVVLYFGYTFCPDVCPTTLAELGRGLQKMGGRAADVQVIMITVDPERDTPARLAEYVGHFDPTFIGLTGAAEQIAAVAKGLGIHYQKREGTAASGYLVDHTASVLALDRTGALRLLFPFGAPGDEIAEDLRRLLDDR